MSITSPEAEPRDKCRAVILLAHGSRQPAAAAGLAATVQAMAERLNVPVRGAFLENGEPNFMAAASVLLAEGITDLAILPLLIYDGRHSLQDVPALIDELRRRYPGVMIRFGRPLGYSPILTDVLLERLESCGF